MACSLEYSNCIQNNRHKHSNPDENISIYNLDAVSSGIIKMELINENIFVNLIESIKSLYCMEIMIVCKIQA